MTDFEKALEFLDKLKAEHTLKKLPSLKPINFFLDYFKRPELSYNQRIIITGTAGKGTTCRTIEKILNDNNISTLTLYSPHIITPLERIRINNKLISKDLFGELILKVKFVSEELNQKISYYECLILTGILAGQKLGCEVLVAEVGLGGDFDATNAIKGDRISAITFIDLDHVKILGDTKELIAEKKLGIVTNETKYFLTYEKDLKDFFIEKSSVKPEFLEFDNYKNEQLAMKICEKILNSNIKDIPNVRLPCRFEKVSNNLILDGAHATARFKDIEKKIKNIPGKKIAIIGMLDTKNHEYLKKILKLFDDIIWTKISFNRNFIEPENFVSEFNFGRVELDLNEIINETKENLNINYFVLGSFYLAGKIRENFISKEYIEETGNEFIK